MLFLKPSLLFVVVCLTSMQVMTITNAQIASLDDPCGGQCRNGGVCTANEADFSSHFILEPLPFHNETSIMGLDENRYHCECPNGWTGVRCDVRFEACSQQQDAGDHHCYHGGQCIEGLIDKYGNEQLFCDCSNAHDSNDNVYYVGKYCEHRSINYCNGDETQFCVNGGECNVFASYGSTTDAGSCVCTEEFTGPHCEFKTNSVPICDLSCQNGGVCVFGEPSDNDHNRYQYWNHDENMEDFMHCSCPDGFDGPTCEIQKTVCGEGHCFHGAECISTDNGDFCDCVTANMEFSNVSYAGRYCQYQATTYCTKSGDMFCVNGGTCKTDPNRAHEGCDCLPGFSGFSCEFQGVYVDNDDTAAVAVVDNDDDPNEETDAGTSHLASNNSRPVTDDPDYVLCDLRCMNGGICRKGTKNYADDIADIIRDVDEFNTSYTVNFEHCVCPLGFIGFQCEYEIETCGENEHHCLHGSTCVSNEGSHSCDCSTTTSEGVYAGDSCQHKATTICSAEYFDVLEQNNGNDNLQAAADTPATLSSFCVNGGTCVREDVSRDESHPGCICLPGYDGPHCEIGSEDIDQDEMALPENEEQGQQHQQEQLNRPSGHGVTEPPVEDIDEIPDEIEINESFQPHTEQEQEPQDEGEEQQQEIDAELQQEQEDDANEQSQNDDVNEDDVEDESDSNNILPAYNDTLNQQANDGNTNAGSEALAIFFGIVIIAVGILALASFFHQRRQRTKQPMIDNVTFFAEASRHHSFRDGHPVSSPNLAPLRDNSNGSSSDGDNQIPRRHFQSSSSTDRIMFDVMESSDMTPLAANNNNHSGIGSAFNHNRGGGDDGIMMMMESSDSTPEATAMGARNGTSRDNGEVLELHQIEIV